MTRTGRDHDRTRAAVPASSCRSPNGPRPELTFDRRCGDSYRTSPVPLDVDLPGRAPLVRPETLGDQDLRHVVDHRGVPAEQDVRVRRRRPLPPGLGERTAAPQALDVSDGPRPGPGLLLGSAHDPEDREARSLALHREELARIAEIPGVPGAEEEREAASLRRAQVGPEDGYVRRGPG